ncbi:MAG: helix-turn-helix domain-containing protein [Saprospiraceae bacterium]
MNLIERISKLERLDQLIRMRATGSPKELADKFKISERQVYRLLDEIKNYGAEVHYCQRTQSYVYEVEFRFSILLGSTEKYKGGKKYLNINISLPNFGSKRKYLGAVIS